MTAGSRASLVGLALLLLAGCGDAAPGAAGGQQTVTSRAIAAVALDHLPDDTTRREATSVEEGDPAGYVGADLRYGGDGESDGDLVRVTVTPERPAPGCEDVEGYDGCAELGDGVLVGWDEVEPEEDPGLVAVWTEREGATVQVLSAGPEITGDPREQQGLEPSVELLAELVADERLAPAVDAATIAAGERVEQWRGGEVEQEALEQVAHTDATLAAGFVGGYTEDWTYLGPSPLRDVLGPRTVGGRVEVGRDLVPVGPGVLDVLVSDEAPAWVAPGSCLRGYRCWSQGRVRFAWRPASGPDPGDSYLLHVLPTGETAAVHLEGPRLPADQQSARYAAGYSLWGQSLTDPDEELTVRLTTSRRRLERAQRLADEHSAG